MDNIALMGKARSGKDTIAARLVSEHGYVRVAFADPLKEMALKIDPWIARDNAGSDAVRLSYLVDYVGWEVAKDVYPEVRRFLQNLGQSVRAHDPHYWILLAMDAIRAAQRRGVPVVVTDVRYENEAEVLRYFSGGFQFVRVWRPGLSSADTHTSETALDGFEPDLMIRNAGSIADLHAQVDDLVRDGWLM